MSLLEWTPARGVAFFAHGAKKCLGEARGCRDGSPEVRLVPSGTRADCLMLRQGFETQGESSLPSPLALALQRKVLVPPVLEQEPPRRKGRASSQQPFLSSFL